jgi:hypothetical protein
VSKTEGTARLLVYVALGVTGLAVVISFLMGRPHSMNFLGKALVTFVGFAALNGAYISFEAAISGLDSDAPAPLTPVTRFWLMLSGIVVLACVWGVLWIV